MFRLNSKNKLQPNQKPVGFWLVLFFLYLLMGSISGAFISKWVLSYVFNGNMDLVNAFWESPQNYADHKVLYITIVGISNLCSYFVSALFFVKKENGLLKFQLSNSMNSLTSSKNWWAIGLVLSILPTVFLLNDINRFIYDWVVVNFDLSIVNQSNQQLEKIYDFLFASSEFKTILFSIVWLAVVPAVGEEIVFRGVLQNLFTRGLKNHHFAIFLTSFIFALLHFEFTGFLTRMLVGALFGYLYFWTKNIYVPIFSHLIFNVSSLILSFLATNKIIPMEIVNSNSFDSFLWVILLVYTVLSVLLIKMFYKKEKVYVIQMDNDSRLQDDA